MEHSNDVCAAAITIIFRPNDIRRLNFPKVRLMPYSYFVTLYVSLGSNSSLSFLAPIQWAHLVTIFNEVGTAYLLVASVIFCPSGCYHCTNST